MKNPLLLLAGGVIVLLLLSRKKASATEIKVPATETRNSFISTSGVCPVGYYRAQVFPSLVPPSPVLCKKL
jgi:hypothetical protein